MTKKKKVTILTLLVATGLLLVLGSTYALWQLTKTQSDTNEITATCLDITYADESSGISLASAWPMKDVDGLETEGYSFTITNNCDTALDYNVEFAKESSSTITDKYIRYNLDYTANSVTLKNRTDTIFYMDDGVNGKVLDSYTVAANGTNTHTLKLWIDEYTPVGYQSKTYSGKINVVGGQGIKAPQILASEMVGDTETINYTWYDNGDLFINGDVDWDGINLTSYLINKYVQDDPENIFTQKEKHKFGVGYSVGGDVVPNEFYFTIVDKPDVAYYKSTALYYCNEIIESENNTNYKEDLYNSIDDSMLKSVFQKLSDNMPRFNRVYVDINGYIPSYLLLGVDANRLSIVTGDFDNYSAIGDQAFFGASTNTFDFRNKGEDYLILENYALYGLYAPNATIIFPNVHVELSSIGLDGIYIDTVELLSTKVIGTAFIQDFNHINTIIYPDNLEEIYFQYDDNLRGATYKHPASLLSDINIKFRGAQRTIPGFTPGNFKSVTWNYFD